MEYGLIGEKLSHSFSKEIHEKIEDYQYVIKEIAPDKLGEFMTAKNFKAINVTIPYKEAVIPYLDVTDDKARLIGAVNTVVNRDGRLYGYNTDFYGMEAMIKKAGISLDGKKTVILGTGGTSKTAVAVARYLGASQITVVSRTVGRGTATYDELYDKHTDANIIINTTPCGMFPHSGSIPVCIDRFGALEGVIDAVYNPIRTKLISSALKRGIKATGGLYMLVAQAVFAAEKFTGKTYPAEICESVYNDVYSSKQNIVLTGMPSCGKTTVSEIISKLSQRPCFDTDEIIVRNHQRPITDIFSQSGEKAFRDMESKAVDEVSQKNGCIIATGGGAVIREENVESLRQNGVLYFLDRNPDELVPTDDRPLALNREAIMKRYNERYDIYLSSADEVIKVDAGPEEIAERIIAIHQKRR